MILNIGSLNQDLVYQVPHLVRPGETLLTSGFARHAGGKGLNQSLALARSGATVFHVGAVGSDGANLIATLAESGVDVSGIQMVEGPTGHALIQKDETGENAILLHGGANFKLSLEQIEEALARVPEGTWLLTQNETNCVPEILHRAKARNLRVAWNPAPMPESPKQLPLEYVDCLILNEVEATQLTGVAEIERMGERLNKRLPNSVVVLTLGAKGAVAFESGRMVKMAAAPVQAIVDTTAAGDTFAGYFLSAFSRGETLEVALDQATRAAALCIQKAGAAPSIPWMRDLA